MTVRKHSIDLSKKFHARCVSIAHRLSPVQADAWLDLAQPFIQSTAEAIHLVSSFSVSKISEPAFQFTIDTMDSRASKESNRNETNLGHSSDSSQCDGLPPCPSSDPNIARTPRNPSNFTVVEAAQAIRRRDVSPIELVKTCLDRIEANDGVVKAWDTIAADKALEQARQAERDLESGKALGPLYGIPFGIKDNIFTEGIRTSGGSRLYESFIPSHDAFVITLLKRAGAIVIGKTTTAEMALGDPPATCNPWNLAHTPGGSSSGSAAAVASGHVPFTLGTQTGGSLNRPAGYTGLVALKPTFGRIDRHGIFPVSWTMDHVGVMTKNAVDQAFIYHSLTGSLASLEMSHLDIDDLRGMTVGIPDRYFFDALHGAQRSAFKELLKVLERGLGVAVKEVVLPPSFEAAVAAHTIIMQCEAAASYADSLEERGEIIGPALRSRLICGRATSAPEYIRAQQIRNIYTQQLMAVFHNESLDVLVTPTSPTPAPKGIHWTGSSMFNSPFTITGFPTIVIPTGFEAGTNLPLSAQFVTLPWQENTLLTLALAYQSVTDWHTRSPNLFDL